MHEPGMIWAGGMLWAVIGMTWVFACAVVLITVWHLRSKRRMERMALLHQERMKAIEKGVPLPEFPGLGEEADMDQHERIFAAPKLNPRWSLGLGALIATGGVGYTVAMLLISDPDAHATWPLGLFGIFIGVGLAFYYLLTRETDRS